ncbi:hypothetical protein R1flu_004645 [Riccia fluitans]|uniref:Cytochrome P450 n=1 Tax=Riccia fluitans TaxID=41844 RepID=A0ABD1YQW7_9MARC
MDRSSSNISFEPWLPVGQFISMCSTVTALLVGIIMLVCGVPRSRTLRNWRLKLPPGPPGLPLIGNLHLLGKLPHQSLTRLSQRYGPVMALRLGSVNTVVVSSAETAKEVLRTQDHLFASRPLTITAEVAVDNSDLIWAPLGERWETLRKACTSQLFNPKVVDRYKKNRAETAMTMVKTIIEESAGQNGTILGRKLVDQMYSNLTQLLFSKRYHGNAGHASDNEAGQLVHMIQEIMAIGPLALGDFIPVLRKLDLDGKEAQLRAVGAKFKEFFQTVIDERRRQRLSVATESNLDFLDVLLSLQKHRPHNHHGLSDSNIRGVLIDLISAGSETSANSLEWVLAELMRHPEILRKVQEELDLVVGKERLVDESDIPQLKYLRAVVKETQRLHPVSPLLIARESVSAARVGGYDIPSKTQVFINAYAIMRDPSVWENPLKFLPERFLTTCSHIDGSGHHHQFLPFGSGRRKCVASNMGLLLIEGTLALLMQTCDFSLPDGMTSEDVNMEESFGHTAPRAKPLELIVRSRTPWLID